MIRKLYLNNKERKNLINVIIQLPLLFIPLCVLLFFWEPLLRDIIFLLLGLFLVAYILLILLLLFKFSKYLVFKKEEIQLYNFKKIIAKYNLNEIESMKIKPINKKFKNYLMVFYVTPKIFFEVLYFNNDDLNYVLNYFKGEIDFNTNNISLWINDI